MQEERLRVPLSEVYAYYSGNEAMVSNVLRDAALDPIVQETMVSFDQYWETVRDVIADAFEASGERHEALLGAIALAQDFQTWRTLVRQQELSQDRAVELMVGMVRCLMRTYSELQKVNPSATRASQHARASAFACQPGAFQAPYQPLSKGLDPRNLRSAEMLRSLPSRRAEVLKCSSCIRVEPLCTAL